MNSSQWQENDKFKVDIKVKKNLDISNEIEEHEVRVADFNQNTTQDSK